MPKHKKFCPYCQKKHLGNTCQNCRQKLINRGSKPARPNQKPIRTIGLQR